MPDRPRRDKAEEWSGVECGSVAAGGRMTRLWFGFAMAIGISMTAVAAGGLGEQAQTAEAHVAAAKAAAGKDHLLLFDRLCAPPPARGAAVPPPASPPPAAPPRASGPPAR